MRQIWPVKALFAVRLCMIANARLFTGALIEEQTPTPS